MEPTNQMNTPRAPKDHSMGALIGSLVIVAILIIGGVYLWRNGLAVRENQEELEEMQTEQQTSEEANAYINAQSTQSTSDDLGDIEQDLNATDVDGVDYGLDK